MLIWKNKVKLKIRDKIVYKFNKIINMMMNEIFYKKKRFVQNVLFVNMKDVEPYDLTFKNYMQPKKKCSIFF